MNDDPDPYAYTEEEVIQALEKAQTVIQHLVYELTLQGIYPQTMRENVIEKQHLISDVICRARWRGRPGEE